MPREQVSDASRRQTNTRQSGDAARDEIHQGSPAKGRGSETPDQGAEVGAGRDVGLGPRMTNLLEIERIPRVHASHEGEFSVVVREAIDESHPIAEHTLRRVVPGIVKTC